MSNIGHNNPPRDGYVLIFRKLLKHPVVGMMKPVKPHKENKPSASRLEAWLDLLMMAAHDSKTVTVNGHKFELERGEQACAMSYLSKRWNWSPKTTRGFIERLMSHEMVERKGQTKDKRPSHLSICNYSDYQDGAQYGVENKGNRKGNRKGKEEGQAGNELTPCKNTINMFSDDSEGPMEGQAKGQKKGQQYKTNNKPNKKTNLKVSQKDKSDLQIALDDYNQLAERAGLPPAKMLSKTRIPKLRARLDEHGLDGWRQALTNIERSSFLCGEQEGRAWKASFDFLLQQSSFLKVLEGQYGNGRVRKPQISPERARELKAKYAAPPPTISEDAR